jgi:hypothetical protein
MSKLEHFTQQTVGEISCFLDINLLMLLMLLKSSYNRALLCIAKDIRKP